MIEPKIGNGRASPFEVMSLLSNRLRVEILASLAGTNLCVSQIADELKIEPSTVSHSLKQLATKGLVEHTPVQRRHFYRLSDAVEVHVYGCTVCVRVSTSPDEELLIRARVR